MSWSQIRGQDAAIGFFRLAASHGRIAHAYLLVGPRGVGKRTFAHELAKSLLCENIDSNFNACDRCPGCRFVAAGTHPDLFVAKRPEDALELPIDVVRELCGQLAMKPMRSGRKVGIVEDAGDLNDASANAFLKTLEEPPPHSVLLLVGGASAEMHLPTIVSRCQVVRLVPLPPHELAELLRAQGIKDAKKIERLVRLSTGSPGQATALQDDALWDFRSNLVTELGSTQLNRVLVSQRWMQFVEDAGKESAAQRRRASLILRLVIDILQMALRASLGAPPTGLEPAELRTVQTLANRLGTERLLQRIDRAIEADVQLDRRVQLVLVIEAFTATLALPPETKAG